MKTQKTASTSIEIALSRLCSVKDILTPISKQDEDYRKKLGYQSPVNYRIPFKKYKLSDYLELFKTRKRKEFYNHMSCLEMKRYLDQEVFNNYYKFCFERNPYDKAISLFYHHGGYKKWNSIFAFVESGGLQVIKGYDQYTINNKIAVNDIFRYEDMEKALLKISNKLNLKNTLELPERKLKSQFRKDKRPYAEILTADVKRMIDMVWSREIELMGYDY